MIPLQPEPALSESKRRLLALYRDGIRERRGTPIVAATDAVRAPLSSEQELIWLHAQQAPGLPLYNEILTVIRKGPLEVAALERALGEIVRRHHAWRTTFELVDGAPSQVVGPPFTFSLQPDDLRQFDGDEREAEALRIATEEARRPFDLVDGPLLRTRLLRMSDDEHRLLIVVHQIIHDGVAVYSVLLPELTALYQAFTEGKESPLPELTVQVADYASWQRHQARSISASLDYWRKQLAGAPAALELPADHPRPAVQGFHGKQIAFVLPKRLGEGMRRLAQRESTTLFVALLAAYEVLLHRYSGQEDLVVGTAVSTRRRPEVEGLLGVFLNTVALRTRLAEAMTFRQLLRRVREVTLEALTHQDVPFQTLVQALQPRRDPARNPIFQTTFVLEPPMPRPAPGWEMTQMDADTGAARVDLYLQLDDRPEGLVGHVRYDCDLWNEETVELMVEHFQLLLENRAADPDQPISAVPMLAAGGAAEHEPAPSENAASTADDAFTSDQIERSIPQRFAAQVERDPHRIAVRGDVEWTYAELDQAANRVARALAAKGVAAGQRVLLLIEPGAPLVGAILGVLKAGFVYVPLDPAHPRARLKQIARDALAAAVLSREEYLPLAATLSSGGMPLLNVDQVLREPPAPPPEAVVQPDRLAYLLYTSGSTGRPKGVAQSHRNVLHFIAAYTNALRLGPGDRLSLLSSASVDAAVMDIFGALLNGATLCPIDVRALGLRGAAGRIIEEKVTVYHSTPTLFRHLVREFDGSQPESVRLVVLGGEEVRREDVEACRKRFPPSCVLVNGFGPTESTVSLQCFVDAAAVLDRSSVPVGRPVERTAVTLLSREGRPGQVFGEITIRSRHLAVGYWRQPELTESVFLPDPSGGKERLYRTGDLGRFLPDGSLEYRGRRDLQVKIHGFRVELGEIEAALAQHPGVAAAAAAAWEPKGGEKAIAGYFVSARDPAPSSDDLRRFLRERLPAHMLPSRFVRLEALPQTPSGKLDRRALPAPAEAAPEREAPAPRDQLEESLLAIWKEVLADATLGTRDDFFDRGGHSLLALQVVAAIESRLQISLPLSALAEAPTVERLAERLRSGGALTVRSLVAMQPRGKRPPLFCVHGHSGEVLFYRELSGRLGAEQPFYGLQSSPDSEPPPRSVEEMAAAYLAAIRAVQPRGPYFIGGYCLGAVVAFEMAQQLIAAGDEVALLALFWGPARRPPLLERIRLHLRELQRLGFWAGTSYLIERAQGGETARAAASRLWQFAYLIDGLLGGWASQRLLRNRPELALHAARSYRPRPYPGRMTVFASGGVGPSCHSDPEAHLAGMIAAEMSVIEVPGDRDSMMREPLVQVIAEQLEGAISRAR